MVMRVLFPNRCCCMLVEVRRNLIRRCGTSMLLCSETYLQISSGAAVEWNVEVGRKMRSMYGGRSWAKDQKSRFKCSRDKVYISRTPTHVFTRAARFSRPSSPSPQALKIRICTTRFRGATVDVMRTFEQIGWLLRGFRFT